MAFFCWSCVQLCLWGNERFRSSWALMHQTAQIRNVNEIQGWIVGRLLIDPLAWGQPVCIGGSLSARRLRLNSGRFTVKTKTPVGTRAMPSGTCRRLVSKKVCVFASGVWAGSVIKAQAVTQGFHKKMLTLNSNIPTRIPKRHLRVWALDWPQSAS